MQSNSWARSLTYVTGLVNQDLLLQCEYLVAENRMPRSHLPGNVRPPTPSGVRSLKWAGLGDTVPIRSAASATSRPFIWLLIGSGPKALMPFCRYNNGVQIPDIREMSLWELWL
jgi:hypothetical protein